MTIFYSYPCTTFIGTSEKVTISTGPVIVSASGDRVLLHLSTDTKKYQFIGGRFDDRLNFRENALARAAEIIGKNNKIILSEDDPLILMGLIEREGNEENILLVHYLGVISDEGDIGEAEWFSLEEVILLDAENKTSSENIKIASTHFLRK